MKKRILGLFLALTVIASLVSVPVSVSAATEGDYIYSVSDGEATITHCYQPISGDIKIPPTLGGCPVTSIGDRAFYNCSSLASIRIPGSVTNIGDRAFSYCSSLTSIGEGLFRDCSSLENISIPEGIASIEPWAFVGCSSLKSISIPDSVTSIGNSAFEACGSLASISIPNSVTRIEHSTFDLCSSLKDVYYNGSETQWNVISIGSYNECLTNANIHYNSNSIGGTAGNSNSTSGGAPIITSAKLSYNGTDYDIFSQEVTIKEDSEISAFIEAAVNNNGCGNVKVYITQGVGKETDITGVCAEIQPGKPFSADKDIYIIAVDEETGKSTAKKTKLRISSAEGEPSDSANYQLKILDYGEIDGKFVINSVATNNTESNLNDCKIYAAVYDAGGRLKAASYAKAVIEGNNDTGVDVTVPCEIASGDVIKTFMWSSSMPLSNYDEITVE